MKYLFLSDPPDSVCTGEKLDILQYIGDLPAKTFWNFKKVHEYLLTYTHKYAKLYAS